MEDPAKRSPAEFQEWAKRTMGPSQRVVYRGEHLRCVAMPLGGIGTGSVALCGDGSLRQWQIFNQVNHNHYVPDSFFAVRAETIGRRGSAVSRVLITDMLYDEEFQNIPTVSDHLVPGELKRLLSQAPGVQSTEFVGEYPLAEIAYQDPDLPVEVSLEACNPMVPPEPEDSGIPGIVFSFTVRNPGDAPVMVSLLGTLQNAVGADPHATIHGVSREDYGGNTNTLLRLRDMTAVQMGNSRLKEDDPQQGSMCLAVLDAEAAGKAQWQSVPELWEEFAATGNLTPGAEAGPSEPARTWNAALTARFRLEPGAQRIVTFLLTWHFPNHYVNWGQGGFGIEDTKSRFYLGNRYNTRFAGALQVAEYLRDHRERLLSATRLYRDTMYDTTLPYWFVDAVTSQTSTLRTPTFLWNEDGNLHGFEGCCGASTGHCAGTGCCPLNCTHVLNYAMAPAKLYPSLERTLRLTDLFPQMSPEGGIAYRTTLPLYLPRWWAFQPEHAVNCADGHWGTILKTCREVRQSGDQEFLEQVWPRVKRAMSFGIGRWDAERDGVLEGPQWNTYDLDFGGKNTFCTTLYLAALRGAVQLARMMGEDDLGAEWEAIADRGGRKVDEELFNGEYYIQIYDEKQFPTHQYGRGCLSDQVWGQWWAQVLDLGYLLDPAHVRSALQAIYRHNFRHDFVDHVQQPRVYCHDDEMGLLICTWPEGGRQDNPMLYCDEIWTHYHIPAHMIWEGMIEEAFHLVKAARDRHDGRRRSPWNDVECGDHYARPMSSWSLLEAAAGYRYDAGEASLAFAPKIKPRNFRCFFITAEGWGTFRQKAARGAQTVSLELKWGRLELSALTLELAFSRLKVSRVTAKAGATAVRVSRRVEGRTVRLTFPEGVALKAGESLEVVIG